MSGAFRVDPRIEASSVPVLDLPLCQVRLQDDRRWPWLVLLPRRASLREVEDLDGDERAALMEEAVRAGRAVRALDRRVEKLNLGALGNVVPQLHVHVVGRWAGDPAWPGPVWGVGVAEPYGRGLDAAVGRAAAALG